MKKARGGLMKRGKYYHAVWMADGKRFARSTGETTRRAAEAALAELVAPFQARDEVETLQGLAARIQTRQTVIDAHEESASPAFLLSHGWLKYMAAPNRPDSGPGTLRMYEGQYKAFASWMAKEHPAAVAFRDVTEDIAEQYAGHLAARGLSANSFNKHTNLLKLVFKVLAKPARLAFNPWDAIGRKRAISNSRRELTVEELKAVYEAATGEIRLLFAIGIYTGLRLGDAATLRWAETDLHRRLIRRIPNKTARRNPKPVIVPIHEDLAAMLDEAPPEERGEFVLPECAELYSIENGARLAKRIQEHFTACGIRTTKPGTGGDAGRAVTEVGFHSLRHSFVSLCSESGVPLSVVQSIVGHTSPAMTNHYTHVGELAAGAAVAGLPSLLGNESRALPPPADTLRERVRAIAEGMNTKTWKTARAELLTLTTEAGQ